MKLKRFGASVAALALAFVAGCGGDNGSSATPEESGGLTKANFASEVSQAQLDAETAHLEADIETAGQQISMSGDVEMAKKDPAFDLTMTGGALGGDAQFILLDRVIYLKMPGLTQGDKFVKVDADESGDPMAEMLRGMLNQLDPSQTFKAFDAVTKLQEKGTQEIDGVETTHYTVTVDTQAALRAQGMQGQVPQGQLPKTLDYDVWVDDENLVRKLRMDVQQAKVDMTLSQWGEPVDISAPPPGQTTDMGTLMQQQQGGGLGGGQGSGSGSGR